MDVKALKNAVGDSFLCTQPILLSQILNDIWIPAFIRTGVVVKYILLVLPGGFFYVSSPLGYFWDDGTAF